MPPLRLTALTELREALEDVEAYNYREFDPDDDQGPCSDCEHMSEDGFCSVLEMGVADTWTCDEYEAAEQEEADREVATLVADALDEDEEEPVEEHRTMAMHQHPHGGGKRKPATAGQRMSRMTGAMRRQRRRMPGARGHYNESDRPGPFAQFLADRRGVALRESAPALVEHNVVPHGPGHGGRGGGAGGGGAKPRVGAELDKFNQGRPGAQARELRPHEKARIAANNIARGKLDNELGLMPARAAAADRGVQLRAAADLGVPRKGKAVDEDGAKKVVQSAHDALEQAGIQVYGPNMRAKYSDNKLGGINKSSNPQNWEVRDGDGSHASAAAAGGGWAFGLKPGQMGIGVAVHGKNYYSDADSFQLSPRKADSAASAIRTAMTRAGFDVAAVNQSGHDGGWGSYNVNFEVIVNKPGGMNEAVTPFADYLSNLREHNKTPHGPGHGGRGRGQGGRMHADAKGSSEEERQIKQRGHFIAGGAGRFSAVSSKERKGATPHGPRGSLKELKKGEIVQIRTAAGSEARRMLGNNSRLEVLSNPSAKGKIVLGNQIEGNGSYRLDMDGILSINVVGGFKPQRARRAGLGNMQDSAALPPSNLGEALSESSAGHVILGEAEKSSLRKDGTFPVKIIDAGWGSSGYYSREVLRKGAEAGRFPMGLKMYWDHPTKQEAADRPERSLRDLAAVTVSPGKWRDDGPDGPGVYAEARAFQQYRPYIEELAPHIGISMRGYGNTKMGEAEGKKGALVEDIVAVQSADFVTQAGRGGKILQLFEAARSGVPIQELVVEESGMDPEEIQALEESNRELMESTARLQEQLAVRDARDMVRDALEASGLPPITRKRLIESLPNGALPFVSTNDALDREAFATQIDEAIKSEQDYIKALGGPSVRGLGESSSAELTDEAAQKQFEEAMTAIIGDSDKAKVAIQGRPS